LPGNQSFHLFLQFSTKNLTEKSKKILFGKKKKSGPAIILKNLKLGLLGYLGLSLGASLLPLIGQ
jgi:hypothetical protein